MMTTTHGLLGASLGLLAGSLQPEVAPAGVLAGFLGGALPDADLLGIHRRSMHFPVLAPVLAVAVIGIAILEPTPLLILAAVAVGSFAVHSAMDALGGGVERRPWRATSERGVYDHVHERWISPRRWVWYAGAPEDLLLAAVSAVPVIALTAGALRWTVVVVLGCSAVFTAVRRRLPTLTDRVFGTPT